MRIMRPFIFAALWCLLFGVGAGDAYACTCVKQTHSEHLRDIDFVAFGRVFSIEREEITPSETSNARAKALFSPKQIWKGTPGGDPVEIRYYTGMCGLDFDEGEELIMFAIANDDGSYSTHMCAFPSLMTSADDDGYRVVRDEYKARWDRLRGAAAARPDDILAQRNLAEFLESEHDRPGAVEAYEKLASLDPDDPAWPHRAGRVWFDLGAYEKALETLRRAAELDPDDRDTRRLIQHARLHQGETLDLRQVDFRGLKMGELDLSGLDLSGKDFSGADLWKTSFEGSRLDGANFENAMIVSANFTGAAAKGIQIRNAEFIRSDFSDADVSGANATGTRFSQTNLTRTNLAGAVADYAQFDTVIIAGANFSKANLAHSRFRDMTLAGASFVNARLNHARFIRADVSGVDLSSATLHRARLRGLKYNCATTLPDGIDPAAEKMIPAERGCPDIPVNLDFRFGTWQGFDFSGLDLHGADFSGSNVSFADFYATDLEGADFTNTSGEGYFAGANLRNANFTNAAEFSFRSSYDRRADGATTDIAGAIFRNATVDLDGLVTEESHIPNLAEAQFAGASIDCSQHAWWITRQAEPRRQKTWSRIQDLLRQVKTLMTRQPSIRLTAGCAEAVANYTDATCAPWIAKENRPAGCVFPEAE